MEAEEVIAVPQEQTGSFRGLDILFISPFFPLNPFLLLKIVLLPCGAQDGVEDWHLTSFLLWQLEIWCPFVIILCFRDAEFW